LLAEKTMRFQNRNVDLTSLRDRIVSFLQSDGFKVQMPKPGENMMLIQAQKGGFLRDLISAERAMNILIQGDPNDFTVRIGIGKWIQDLGVTAVETILISELFLPLDVAEMAWNFEVESKISKKVQELVGAAPLAAR
jgi:hypothetical protein